MSRLRNILYCSGILGLGGAAIGAILEYQKTQSFSFSPRVLIGLGIGVAVGVPAGLWFAWRARKDRKDYETQVEKVIEVVGRESKPY